MRRILMTVVLSISLFGGELQAQITLEECLRKARDNYPSTNRNSLLRSGEEYTLKNASTNRMPQISLSAKATYQTEVTKMPISLPGIDVPSLPKDQYGVTLEVTQSIWDGGVTGAQRDAIRAEYEVQQQQYEVEMYSLNERINELYFGILLLDQKIKLNEIYQGELKRNYDKVVNYIANGVASDSDLDAVEVERWVLVQSLTELTTMNSAYRLMLSNFIGEQIEMNTELIIPPSIEVDGSHNNRPELLLFDAKASAYSAQQRGIKARDRMKIGVFVQGGYGNPGLNMLKDKFEPYAIGGVRMSWNFGGLYTRKREMRKLDLNVRMVDMDREVFIFNSSLQATQYSAVIAKYTALIESDGEIIALRQNLTRAAEAKVESGTMSVTDMLREIDAEQRAKHSKATHEMERLKSMYDFKITLNN